MVELFEVHGRLWESQTLVLLMLQDGALFHIDHPLGRNLQDIWRAHYVLVLILHEFLVLCLLWVLRLLSSVGLALLQMQAALRESCETLLFFERSVILLGWSFRFNLVYFSLILLIDLHLLNGGGVTQLQLASRGVKLAVRILWVCRGPQLNFWHSVRCWGASLLREHRRLEFWHFEERGVQSRGLRFWAKGHGLLAFALLFDQIHFFRLAQGLLSLVCLLDVQILRDVRHNGCVLVNAKREAWVLRCKVYCCMVMLQIHRHRELLQRPLRLDDWPRVALLLEIVVLDREPSCLNCFLALRGHSHFGGGNSRCLRWSLHGYVLGRNLRSFIMAVV